MRVSTTDPPVRLAVIGAGLIGRSHIAHIAGRPEARLAAVVDPRPEAADLAAADGAPWYPSIAAMLATMRPDGAIVATPNQLHVAHGLACIAAGIATLVEKPLADDLVGAERLVDAAERAGVPLLTGHHRRHNPLIQRARQAIEDGRLGRIMAVHTMCWFCKPDSYFAEAWRRQPGGGPVLLNLIHDVDLLRYLCGEVVAVQAAEAAALRGFAVEEVAAILLHFASGALGTLNVSDAVPAPWSWEFTSGENPAYTQTMESCTTIGGTAGSLSLPHLDLWRHPLRPDWWTPLAATRLSVAAAAPLGLQIANLCGVIRGTAAPVVSGLEGLRTLRVIDAIKRAARSGGVERV